MTEIYGAAQPLTGAEIVNILQTQNGQMVNCSIPVSQIAALASGSGGTSSFDFASYADSLSTTLPSASGTPWNNGGLISVS